MKNSKVVLHVVQGGLGGTSRYIEMLLKRIDKEKFKNIVVCHGEIFDKLNNEGFNVHNLEMFREISIFKDLKSTVRLIKFIKMTKPDIIYCHSSKAGVLSRLAVLFNKKVKVVYNPHGWSFNIKTSKIKQNIYLNIEKMTSFRTDKYILISSSEYQDAVIKKIAKDKKLELITNGVDINFIKEQNNFLTERSKSNTRYITFCGRLSEQKNPLFFLEIAKNLLDSYNEIEFLVIGDGELKDSVLNFVQKNKLYKKIHIIGWTNNVYNLMQKSYLGIVPSNWEGFGLVVPEFMANGVPVIASSVDGLKNIINNSTNGYLCTPGDLSEFAEKIKLLLDDQKLYRELSEKALIRSEDFNIERVIERHEEIFNDL